jgi:hypothetical protein
MRLDRFRGRIGVRVIEVVVLTLALAGCSIAEKITARSEHQQSADNYKQCMAANPTAAQKCESLRSSMEAVERKRDSISTDLTFQPGTPPPEYANSQ